ncbi:Uncharacterised protein [Mycobacterium tuberculosis]|uniref:Uncharacterized protein n=1 Tax=Mycobacterium tuberculosis TaxID=1773 RepID=A0A0U0SNJ9_MYCTX|nr:Uncharacterised protein [Mycobacterium tuberculosis]CKS96942.1 Uncharacterised protein [Mycobacterium tuberculosis]COW88221.1 Uncharacterised protein [Mycobacterium tuberculosis]COX04672.1 Uncharacterised protein [Mycobacterium tuberculosis]COY79469.1 Uncharacterised protein [Mycobacterium tuberculosis]
MDCTNGPKSWLNRALATTRNVVSTMLWCMSNCAPGTSAAVTSAIGSIIRPTSPRRWRRAKVEFNAPRCLAHESPSSVSKLRPAVARIGPYSSDLTYFRRASCSTWST